MATGSFSKFEKRLVLAAYFRQRFGISDPDSPSAVRRFHEALADLREGYDDEGRSYVAGYLRGRVDGITEAKLLRYDQNVRRHTEALNARRSEPITLKYFQVLAALMTEHYLDRLSQSSEDFLADLNAFAAEQNKHRTYIKYPTLERDDLSKVAFWMATGSGKTLLMHLNYYQYLDYQDEPLDHVLLVTPNEGLSNQHLAAMKRSGIDGYHFLDAPTGLLGGPDDAIKVIEITKLIEEKTGEGDRIEVSAFEGNNLVFVDEGHKGSGSEAGAWRSYRAQLAERGFTFEYSATFGQAVGGSTKASVEEEYGKAILFDYSYRHFHEDGYGKDYRILNLEEGFDEQLRQRYLLANLLTFYEQVRVYEQHKSRLEIYNLKAPLMLFMGHSVTAGKTRSSLSGNDKQSISDVQELIRFLHGVVANGDNWVSEAIEAILQGEAGLEHEDGSDLFASAFQTLRQSGESGEDLYRDLLQRLFHTDAPAGLHLVDLKGSEGEIGLRTGASDTFFGVINIGNDASFLQLTEEKLDNVLIEASTFEGSLFKAVNQQDSSVNFLIGSKKFIEGWSSWRVSTMGLMNIGRGEGPEIIQLFGRGVRLLGKNRTLQRSTALPEEGPHPDWLSLLETLNIFGVRAKYMAQFRDYLAAEGIETDERVSVPIKTRLHEDFLDKGLVVIRQEQTASFEEEVALELEIDADILPEIDLMPRMEAIVSEAQVHEAPVSYDPSTGKTIPGHLLSLLDWNRLYRDLWQFREKRGYLSLTFDKDALRRLLEDGHYHLVCRGELLQCQSYEDLRQVENIAGMILRKYVSMYYDQKKREWEQQQLAYQPLQEGDDNLVTEIQAQVKRSHQKFLNKLQSLIGTDTLYEKEKGKPPRVYFDRHFYLPLLKADDSGDEIVKYTPPGLNSGEWTFVKNLRDFIQGSKGQSLLEEHELYLLRNQARGYGVGFLVDGKRYFPDFILWLKSEERQEVAFIDPKGLVHTGNLEADYKVKLHKTIKDYERKLNKKAGRKDVRLHAFIVSTTDYSTLRKQSALSTREAFNNRHIFFPSQEDHIAEILHRIVQQKESPAST